MVPSSTPMGIAGSIPSRSATKARFASAITSFRLWISAPGSGRAFRHQDDRCDCEWTSRCLQTKAGRDQSPVPSSGHGAYRFAVFSGEGIGKIRIEQHVNRPAIAAGTRFVPATTGGNCRRDGRKREYRQAARRGTVRDESRHSQFLPDNRDSADQVGQLLPCRPARRLAQSAIGGEREGSAGACFRHKRTRSATSAGVSM